MNLHDAVAKALAQPHDPVALPKRTVLTDDEVVRAPQTLLGPHIPEGRPSLIAADGGVGKSNIMTDGAVCASQGLEWIGHKWEQCDTLLMSCEDAADVLKFRIKNIARKRKIKLSALFKHLHVLDFVGLDALLFSPGHGGDERTALYYALKQYIANHKIRLVIIDTMSDVFGGSEISRGEIKRFFNLLRGLGATVIVLAHVDKVTAKNPQTTHGFSGSTAQSNAVAWRAYLYHETRENGERTGRVIGEVQKANYGETGARFAFEWDADAHMFVGAPMGGATVHERAKQDDEESAGIVAALRACAEKGIHVPAAATGSRTAAHVLVHQAAFPEALRDIKQATVRRRFWRLLEGLRASGEVSEGKHRRPDGKTTVTLLAREASDRKEKY